MLSINDQEKLFLCIAFVSFLFLEICLDLIFFNFIR